MQTSDNIAIMLEQTDVSQTVSEETTKRLQRVESDRLPELWHDGAGAGLASVARHGGVKAPARRDSGAVETAGRRDGGTYGARVSARGGVLNRGGRASKAYELQTIAAYMSVFTPEEKAQYLRDAMRLAIEQKSSRGILNILTFIENQTLGAPIQRTISETSTVAELYAELRAAMG